MERVYGQIAQGKQAFASDSENWSDSSFLQLREAGWGQAKGTER